jgi:hypothetical protein
MLAAAIAVRLGANSHNKLKLRAFNIVIEFRRFAGWCISSHQDMQRRSSGAESDGTNLTDASGFAASTADQSHEACDEDYVSIDDDAPLVPVTLPAPVRPAPPPSPQDAFARARAEADARSPNLLRHQNS